jgi:hypothetical protein
MTKRRRRRMKKKRGRLIPLAVKVAVNGFT